MTRGGRNNRRMQLRSYNQFQSQSNRNNTSTSPFALNFASKLTHTFSLFRTSPFALPLSHFPFRTSSASLLFNVFQHLGQQVERVLPGWYSGWYRGYLPRNAPQRSIERPRQPPSHPHKRRDRHSLPARREAACIPHLAHKRRRLLSQ